MLGPILNTIPKSMKDLGDSYLVKPDLDGISSKAVAVVCTIIEAEHKTYRETCFGHTRTRQRKGSIVLHKLMIVAIPFVFHRGAWFIDQFIKKILSAGAYIAEYTAFTGVKLCVHVA